MIALWRRFALASTGLAISAALLRGQLADALVTRGDEFLYRARPTEALKYYVRALTVDSTDAIAIDRLLFVSQLVRSREGTESGIRLATHYLRAHPEDDVLRMDRAMALRADGRHADALADFERVGKSVRDGRALTFAGFEADALGWRKDAVSLWRAAEKQAPGLPAPRHALQREAGEK